MDDGFGSRGLNRIESEEEQRFLDEHERFLPQFMHASACQRMEISREKELLPCACRRLDDMALAILILQTYNPSYEQRVMLGAGLIIFYVGILFFLLERRIVREITHHEIHRYEQPVYQEVVKEVEKPIYREVPVVKEIVKEVEKPVIVQAPVKRSKEFVGSTQTMTFHHRTCKFSKLIKPHYRIEESKRVFLERKGFKRCRYLPR
jgi:hypothetical protein